MDAPAGTARWRRIGPALYVLWAAAAISLAIAKAGLSAESVTRLLVLAFLLAQFALRPLFVKALPTLAPRARFVVLGTALATAVEGFHMISKPVFASLRVGPGTPLAQALASFGIDLLFTVPAYVAILSVMWTFVSRHRYPTWSYVLAMGSRRRSATAGSSSSRDSRRSSFSSRTP